MSKADLAREYRKKHGPDMPTKKLARIMYDENKLLFTNEEAARTTFRDIEGKHGKSRVTSKVKNSEFFIHDERPRNPYNLPDSDETIYDPYIIKGHKRIAVLSDVHVPYHSISALSAALEFCKKEKVDAVLLNGDTLDCFQLSRFNKDPRKRHFADELEVMKEVLFVIQKILKCKIYFKYGNHEERYENFLFQKAKELIGVDEFELDSIIQSRVPGVEIIKDKRIIKLNGLNVIHGHEYTQGIFNPVNVARGLFLRGKTSALQGHSHQTSEHTESDMNGKITTTWSLGCLSELSPAYMPLNKWNHGFCIVDLYGKDGFDVRNKRIHKGRIL